MRDCDAARCANALNILVGLLFFFSFLRLGPCFFYRSAPSSSSSALMLLARVIARAVVDVEATLNRLTTSSITLTRTLAVLPSFGWTAFKSSLARLFNEKGLSTLIRGYGAEKHRAIKSKHIVWFMEYIKSTAGEECSVCSDAAKIERYPFVV